MDDYNWSNECSTYEVMLVKESGLMCIVESHIHVLEDTPLSTLNDEH